MEVYRSHEMTKVEVQMDNSEPIHDSDDGGTEQRTVADSALLFRTSTTKNAYRNSGTSQIWYITQTTFTTPYRNWTKRQHAKIPLEDMSRNIKTKGRQKMSEGQLKPNSDSTATVLPLIMLMLNPLNAELNPICYLLALLGGHHLIHVSRIRVKSLSLRLLMSYIYIYGAPILDVSRSHTTTQHSR